MQSVTMKHPMHAVRIDRRFSYSIPFFSSFLPKILFWIIFANLTTTPPSPSPLHPTCEISGTYFDVKTSHFCINRTFVCGVSLIDGILSFSEEGVFSSGDLDCSDSSDEENCEEKILLHSQRLYLYAWISLCTTNGMSNMIMHHCAFHWMSYAMDWGQCPLGDDEHQARCRMWSISLENEEKKRICSLFLIRELYKLWFDVEFFVRLSIEYRCVNVRMDFVKMANGVRDQARKICFEWESFI